MHYIAQLAARWIRASDHDDEREKTNVMRYCKQEQITERELNDEITRQRYGGTP